MRSNKLLLRYKGEGKPENRELELQPAEGTECTCAMFSTVVVPCWNNCENATVCPDPYQKLETVWCSQVDVAPGTLTLHFQKPNSLVPNPFYVAHFMFLICGLHTSRKRVTISQPGRGFLDLWRHFEWGITWVWLYLATRMCSSVALDTKTEMVS